ncbi:FAD-dependent oxidoreductase [Clostridium sp. cel8]|uniref:NAD(P)/FAD-dependent oxidoreductase n=1 Tax=Clostridium sp. cel8 TaxID=2663123 RepID=UPI0015F5C10A|nr:FAD-dependent oxidoreductase [Clostridium sp. cel8]MBA5850752.1 FAD-dependent oxidoreductase [Clostridium sp. cel8]
MKKLSKDLVIIGGGPAGMAAAVEAKNLGIKDILIIERDVELGGILQQCIHDGFGLMTFHKTLTGGQYAQKFITKTKELQIEVKLNTMVLEITQDKKVYATNEDEGLLEIQAKSIILSMGCRERTRAQVFIAGTRPAGVYTAGTVQRYINMEGYLPGKKAVILGSGDIGLIMARRMTLEGIKVEGVYEIMHSPGGLTRNIVQCLKDYDIPLHLGTTVTKIHGKGRVEGVTVCEVDKDLKPIKSTERYIECDLVVLSVGLIPENELTTKANIEIDPVTRGPVVDENMMTSIPGIFAAGNVVAVFDLVDYVSKTGAVAAKGAFKYINNRLNLDSKYLKVKAGENISVLIPQRIRRENMEDKMDVFLRVRKQEDKTKLMLNFDDKEIQSGRYLIVKPPEMVHTNVLKKDIEKACNESICFNMLKEV